MGDLQAGLKAREIKLQSANLPKLNRCLLDIAKPLSANLGGGVSDLALSRDCPFATPKQMGAGSKAQRALSRISAPFEIPR
jgi:hypothetical protein